MPNLWLQSLSQIKQWNGYLRIARITAFGHAYSDPPTLLAHKSLYVDLRDCVVIRCRPEIIIFDWRAAGAAPYRNLVDMLCNRRLAGNERGKIGGFQNEQLDTRSRDNRGRPVGFLEYRALAEKMSRPEPHVAVLPMGPQLDFDLA